MRRAVPLERVGAGPQVLGHGEPGEHGLAAGDLDDAERHPLVGGEPVDRLAAEGDGAGDCGASPEIDPQQRRLAGAVRAEQGDDLAGVDAQVDAEEHLDVAVGEVDAARLEQGRARRPSRYAVPGGSRPRAR